MQHDAIDVFIVHGLAGSPGENWVPWLKRELEKEGHKVIVPQFPTPANQTLTEWMKIFEQYRGYITPNTIVVGHSLGVPFLLNVMEQMRVKAAFLVAGFVGKFNNQFDEVTKTFAQKTFNWQQIKRNCKNFTVFHSDNDPYIKLEKAEELARLLGVEVTLVKGAGHFNSTVGYTTFDLLLEKIRSL